jgi:hypothetical protein
VCACGGNIVVDGATRPSGTGGLGTGGIVGSSTTSGPITSGPGPVTVSSTSGPTAASVTVTTVTASSTTTTTTTAASSTGGFGGCTNPQDEGVLATHVPATIDQDLYNCTVSQIGNPGGTAMCLVLKDGFSLQCAWCFADEGQCGAKLCLNQCVGGVPSPGCLACLAANCNAGFTSCSGIPFPV